MRRQFYIPGTLFLGALLWFMGKQERYVHRHEEISKDSIFIYRAYLDRRGRNPKIRLLAFNGCHNDSVLHVHQNGSWQPLKPIPMYNTCPEAWGFGCSLIAYFHELIIMIKGPNGRSLMPLHVAQPANELGITICIAPMFWYTDWAKLIFFIEFWRKQKAENIMVYVHSTNDQVKEVLDFYEQKDWISIIPWPMLPRSETFQPNDEVFRLGQILAVNDCILRSKTIFTTTVDIDEIMHSRTHALTDFLILSFEDKRIGSITFPHHSAVFEKPLLPKNFQFEEVDYKGVSSVRYWRDHARRPKVIARTNSVDRMAVHYVAAFRNKEVNKTARDAMLFHIRYDLGSSNPRTYKTNIVSDPEWFQLVLLSKTRSIFPSGASFNKETQNMLAICVDSWQETQDNCMAPTTYCRQTVIDKETWAEETGNAFTVL